MSSLTTADRLDLERLLGMATGYVLGFSNRSFHMFVFENVKLDIDDPKYEAKGTSKANRLRTFWEVESDYTVGKLLVALFAYIEEISIESSDATNRAQLLEKCRPIAARLLAGSPSMEHLKEQAVFRDANHLAAQIRRIEESVEVDPSLAIGTAKEMIETCCKTILAERGIEIAGSPDIPSLTKQTLKVLRLVPEGVQDHRRGADVIKRILSNLGSIGNGLAELRGLYGTGHGQHGKAAGLSPRHAKLAVGAAATLAIFLFETHSESNRT